MGQSVSQVGGGSATGLGNDLVNWLKQGLATGTFGGGSSANQYGNTDPTANTRGISGVLNDLLMGGGGKIGGSMADMITKDTERQAQALRARFGAVGGTSFGTPAAYAESMLRSEQAPKLVNAIGDEQLKALQLLLPMFSDFGGKGIAQRENIAQPNPWLSAFSSAAQGTAAIAPFFMDKNSSNPSPTPSSTGSTASDPYRQNFFAPIKLPTFGGYNN